jgi:predicted heme/steroid binding protein
MAELRERKCAPKKAEAPQIDECKRQKTKANRGPSLQPSLFLAIAMIAALVLVFGASAQSTTDALKLTEEELKAYDGTDPNKPIYLGIDGLIFDVSSSPAFYGPGGHYHHFVGKDATRAWVTECWDEPEQFTWRMDDVEVMFTPKWLDEQIENVGRGKVEDKEEELQGMQGGQVGEMAKKVMEKFGTVTDKEKAKRRKEDAKVAKAKVKETLDHWKKFFQGSGKYKQVGEVIRDESRPAPPKPCAEAMKKRPLNGGRLEALAGQMGDLFGGGGAEKPKSKGEMPDFVKQKLKEKEKEKEAGGKDEL